MKTHGHRKDAARAFTLVELLMVIVIIAILASLLIPAITAAIEHAQSLECRNNLKELSAAVLKYAAENNNVIVPAYDEEAGLYWANILVMRNYVKATNLVATPNEDPLEKRCILLCPSTSSLENTTTTAPVSPFDDKAQGWVKLGKEKTHQVACSYYWNGCTDKTLILGTGARYGRQFPSLLIPKDDTNKRQYLHYLTEIRQRTTFVMALDGIFTDAQVTPQNRGRIAARHRGTYGKRSRTNVVFYDGHAEEYEWTLDNKNKPPWLKDPLWITTELHPTSNPLTGGSLIFRLDDQTPASP